MNFIDSIFDFFLGKTRPFLHKIAGFFIILIIAVLLDIQFRFSQNYYSSNKIDEIQKHTQLIKSDNTSYSIKRWAYKKREQLIHVNNIYESLDSFMSSFSLSLGVSNKA